MSLTQTRIWLPCFTSEHSLIGWSPASRGVYYIALYHSLKVLLRLFGVDSPNRFTSVSATSQPLNSPNSGELKNLLVIFELHSPFVFHMVPTLVAFRKSPLRIINTTSGECRLHLTNSPGCQVPSTHGHCAIFFWLATLFAAYFLVFPFWIHARGIFFIFLFFI